MKPIHEIMAQSTAPYELSDSLQKYFAEQEINSLAVTYYQQHTKTGNELIYEWASSPIKIWHQYYLEHHYANIDRTLESSEQSLLPVFWDVHQQLRNAKNKREKRIREESIQYGINKGLCIPIHGPDKDFLILVLHQRTQEQGLLHWQEKQYLWMGITHVYFHFLRKLLLPEKKHPAGLTKREKQCLAYTAQGIRVGLIGKNLNISERTVNFHLQNANKKLGVNNKYQAVMLWKQIME